LYYFLQVVKESLPLF